MLNERSSVKKVNVPKERILLMEGHPYDGTNNFNTVLVNPDEIHEWTTILDKDRDPHEFMKKNKGKKGKNYIVHMVDKEIDVKSHKESDKLFCLLVCEEENLHGLVRKTN